METIRIVRDRWGASPGVTIDAARSAHEARVSTRRLDARYATAAAATLGAAFLDRTGDVV